MNNYRITGYDPKHDFTFILDSYGMFDVNWKFSSYLVLRGLKILKITDIENYDNLPNDKEHLYLRKTTQGKVETLSI